MNFVTQRTKCALAFFVAGIVAAGSAMADKGGKHEGKDRRDDQRSEQRDDRRDEQRKSQRDDDRHSSGQRGHFQERQYVVVREYYAEHYRGRRCPPGLAKKQNGCMPPGHEKKWRVGYQLPREVVYYAVPAPLVVQIGPPPAGHRYVRVAGDILLLAIGTGMVVDAISDLGSM